MQCGQALLSMFKKILSVLLKKPKSVSHFFEFFDYEKQNY